MRLHVLTTTEPVTVEDWPTLPIDQDPAGWVWSTQKPLVISTLDGETRWPKSVERARRRGLCSLLLVPLSIGERRVGVLGFGARSVYEPVPGELSFLERVASEFAVTVDSFLMQQTIVRERDRFVLQSRKELFHDEHRFDTPDGGVRYAATKRMPIFDEKGEPLYLMTVINDLTERRRANERIAAINKYRPGWPVQVGKSFPAGGGSDRDIGVCPRASAGEGCLSGVVDVAGPR